RLRRLVRRQNASRQLPDVATRRVPVLADQHHPIVLVRRDDRRGAGMMHELEVDLCAVRQRHPLDPEVDDPPLVDLPHHRSGISAGRRKKKRRPLLGTASKIRCERPYFAVTPATAKALPAPGPVPPWISDAPVISIESPGTSTLPHVAVSPIDTLNLVSALFVLPAARSNWNSLVLLTPFTRSWKRAVLLACVTGVVEAVSITPPAFTWKVMVPEDVFTCTWDDLVRLQSVPVTAVGFVRLILTPLAGGTTPAPAGKTSARATRASSVFFIWSSPSVGFPFGAVPQCFADRQ